MKARIITASDLFGNKRYRAEITGLLNYSGSMVQEYNNEPDARTYIETEQVAITKTLLLKWRSVLLESDKHHAFYSVSSLGDKIIKKLYTIDTINKFCAACTSTSGKEFAELVEKMGLAFSIHESLPSPVLAKKEYDKGKEVWQCLIDIYDQYHVFDAPKKTALDALAVCA